MKAHNSSRLIVVCVLTFVVLLPFSALTQWFGDLVQVSNFPENTDSGTAIAVDQDNHVHIVWNSFYYQEGAPDNVTTDIFYTHNKNGDFTEPVKISVSTGWYSREPTIAVDAAGNAHVVFRRSEDQLNVLSTDDLYYVNNINDNFENPILIIDGITGILNPDDVCMPSEPRIHCDSQGNCHLSFDAWEFVTTDEKYFDCLLYMHTTTGSWSTPELIVSGDFITDYNSCLDEDNKIHIAFSDQKQGENVRRIYYTNNVDGEFVAPVVVTSEDSIAQTPDIAIDGNGKAHIVCEMPFVGPWNPEIYYIHNISGSFGPSIPIAESHASYIPGIAVDDSDYVHISYKRAPTNGGELFYGNNKNSEFEFISYDEIRDYWYIGSRYFSSGEHSSIHFAFYDFMTELIDENTEVFYLPGSWLPFGVTHDQPNNVPKDFVLYPNYPNPFNPFTNITFYLPTDSFLTLKIYNVLGHEIETVVNEHFMAGEHRIIWNAKALPSGIYFCFCKTYNFTAMQKLLVQK